MPSFSKIALGLAQVAFLSFPPLSTAGHSDHCRDFPVSCTNHTVVPNTCCFSSPGGELLQTQFWDTDPATGPANHWTVHGLWYTTFPYQFTQQLTVLDLLGQTIAMAPTTNTAMRPVSIQTSVPSSAPTAAPPSSLTWKPTGKTKAAMTSLSGSTNGASTAPASPH